jgi:large subunit ribosomal protein L21
MVYAVIESGGKQYVARSGETIEVDRLNLKQGEEVTFEDVLLIAGDGSTQVGVPHVEGATVVGHVVEDFKGPKIVVFHYKPKIRYRKRQGHRQWYTRVIIDDVVLPGKAKKGTKKADAEAAPEAAKPAESPKPKPEQKAKAPTKKASEKPAKAAGASQKTSQTKKPAASVKKTSSSTKKTSGTGEDKTAE